MKKILIIQADFYQDISKLLLDGALKEIAKLGFEHEIVTVPGALEIPATIALAKDKFDGFVALGCVIRGETSHYDYVCGESARGLNDLAIKEKLAIGNGILTVENKEQAIARADENQKNKGGFAVTACTAMIALKEKFS